jgi:hypothetical protein
VWCSRRSDRFSDEQALIVIVNYVCLCSNLVAIRYHCVQVVLLILHSVSAVYFHCNALITFSGVHLGVLITS